MRPTIRHTVRLTAIGCIVAALAGCTEPGQPGVFEQGGALGPDWMSVAAERMSDSGAGGFEFADTSPDMVDQRAKSRAQYGK
ncbi:MAG: hypothetical protein ACREJO_17045 [Phycisphaerales bacterium]